MKFDIFDKSTWNDLPQEDPETRTANRAIGAIGQKISELRLIRKQLESAATPSSLELTEAINLRNNDPKAFKDMNIKIIYNDVNDAMMTINEILSLWDANGDQKSKHLIWRQVIDLFEKLKHLMDTYGYNHSADLVHKFITPTVEGNHAWRAYFHIRSENIRLAKEVVDLRSKVSYCVNDVLGGVAFENEDEDD